MHDFYSDTQTRPSRAMRESMLDAEVGDERHDDCPTTARLNQRVAEMFGMEAAVFMPSGTMCNEIAIAVHCLPGDEVICARESHVIFAESGGPAALSGVMMMLCGEPLCITTLCWAGATQSCSGAEGKSIPKAFWEALVPPSPLPSGQRYTLYPQATMQ